MASIALKRGDSFSSNDSSEDGGKRGGFLNRGNVPTSITHGLFEKSYGPTLTSLEYQPQVPFRRHSLARDGSSSTMADDLSLVGECDVSSIRSNNSQSRPGRRASLSAAIELTRTAPPKFAEPPRTSSMRKGRRNSLFGNSGSKDKEEDNNAPMARKMSSRRASMTGYPAAAAATVAEPEPTPQFFHKHHKKEKKERSVPDRKKTKSFDKHERALGKIRRPGKGSRRASMSAMLTKSSSKKSDKSGGSGSNNGSKRSLQSSNSSEYDLSDDGSTLGGSGYSNNKSRVGNAAAFRSPRHSIKPGDEVHLDLGYDDLGYDPQLPPPPEASSKPSRKSQFKFDRRGSTGTAMTSFPSNSAAQKSLKESLQWKNEKAKKEPKRDVMRSSIIAQRRFSNASLAHSVATDLDVAHNRRPLDLPPPKQKRQSALDMPPQRHSALDMPAQRLSDGSDILLPPQRLSDGSDILLPQRRGPMDIPPQRHSPMDIPPQRHGPMDVPPQRHTPMDVTPQRHGHGPMDIPPPSSRAPADVPPRRGPSDVPPSTPTQAGRATITLENAPGTPMGSSEEDDSSYSTPVCSNRKVHAAMENSQTLLGLMSDDSGSSIESSGAPGGGFSMLGSRRASRGLSVLNKPAPPIRGTPGRTSALGGSAMLGGVNPYGSTQIRSESDEEDDDDDDEDGGDEEETEEERAQNQKMAEFGSEAGDPVYTGTTAESTTETMGTMTSTEQSSEDQEVVAKFELKDEKKKDKDDASVGSMESEAPKEKAPDDLDTREMIEATGDWSAVVGEEVTTNSILEKYPGSEIDYEGQDLGYSHMGGPSNNMLGYDDESERKYGDPDYEQQYENGYGVADLYDEDYSSFGWKERPARAAQSLEFINMEQLAAQAKTNKKLYVPKFIPAHGCTNASDYIVRCFVARLRAGVTVTKHSRSRFCKSHDRILHILPTGYHITWIPETEEEVVEKSKKKPPTKLDLTKCIEVRHAWSRDPKSKKYTGTSTLRAKCKEGAANRSFALIYPKRTVDFTAMTVDQCKLLMEGFSALCFRLQMARLEQAEGEEFTQNSGISGTLDHDDDSATASLTGTNMSAPWGL